MVNTQLSTTVTVVLVGAFLIGGPWWLVSNAVARRKARNLVKLRAEHAEEIGAQLLRELGPLTEVQVQFVYEVVVRMVAINGLVNLERLRWAVSSARVEAGAVDSESLDSEPSEPLRLDDGPRDWTPPVPEGI